MERLMSGHKLARSLAAAVLGLLVACGGGGGGGGTTPQPGATGDDVADTLARLGISTAATPRLGAGNLPLPADYSPLGKKRTLVKTSEMFVAWAPLASASDPVNLLKFVPGGTSTSDHTESLPAGPLDASWKTEPYNAAAACDVDGDGLEETALLWWSSSDNAIRLKFIGNQGEAFALSSASVIRTGVTPSHLKIVCADLDGNGSDEPIVGVADDTAGKVTLDVLSGSRSTGYLAEAALHKEFVTPQAGARLGIEIAAGRLDRDAGLELGVVVNAVWNLGCPDCAPDNGQASYYIYDDRNAGLAELRQGRVGATIGAATHNGQAGNIAIGDIDGDGVDNVVLAALTTLPRQCANIDVVQFTLDDEPQSFLEPALAKRTTTSWRNCEPNGSGGQAHIEHLWLHTLDIDGDQVKEVVVNTEIYDDFRNAANPWEPLMVEAGGPQPVVARIPQEYLYKDVTTFPKITKDHATMVVGNVNADSREDLILLQSGRVQVDLVPVTGGFRVVNGLAVTVWGLDPVTGRWGKNPSPNGDSQHMGLLYLEALGALNQRLPGPPIVVPVDVDRDSTTLLYEAGSHRVVFSEPIVHAALAAPPCWGDGSQVSDDCRTSWGTGSSSGGDRSISHEISARVHRGLSGDVDLPIVGEIGVEFEASVGLSIQREASLGYELTRTVTYTTGPMEDTVVATVVPYDQYSYRILSHPADPQLVGKDMVISLPRSPRTIQINRRFYNDSLVGTGPRIDDSVFTHTIGNPKSYPTRSQMFARSGAKRIGPQAVGASSGNQSVTISEATSTGLTTTLGVSYETTINATSGKAMAGFTVGGSAAASLGISMGTEVTFSGTVGDMPPATFSLDKAYNFGMFVYQQAPTGTQRPMQVINYWVE